MQTFLPYPDFAASAKVLDRQRLGKQRVETLQITRALVQGRGWIHHPATKMWANHLGALLAYQRAICGEWVGRGYADTCLHKTLAELVGLSPESVDPLLPPWFDDEVFHRAHQSNLIRKDPAFYGPQFPGVPDDLPYLWPVS